MMNFLQAPMRKAFWLRALLVVGLLCAFAQGHAWADDVYTGLSSTNFSKMQGSIEEISGSGEARALPVLLALKDGALHARRGAVTDGSLFIKSEDGSFVDARTGGKVAVEAAALRLIRPNNAVRSAVDAALGALQLFSPDTATRRHAAEAVFLARDAANLKLLDKAQASEKNEQIRTLLSEARASILLAAADTPEKDGLEAVKILRLRGDQAARALLETAANQPPAVIAAARDAASSIARVQQMWSILQNVFYGVSLGSVLLLAASGLAITFGVMGVINMAHGEMVMIGAYVTYIVQDQLKIWAPGLMDYSLAFAIPLAFLVSGIIGIAIERGLIRFLYGRPLETLLATWGLSLALQQAVRSIFGPTNREVSTPGWMSGEFHLAGLAITWNRLYIIIFAIAVVAAIMIALRRTSLGLQMRAVTQNRKMAAAMGIRTPWVDAMTFGLGSGVAGMAGVALSQIDNVSPNLGQGYIIDSFMVVVFGGVGNLWGTVVSATMLGVINKFLEPVAGAVLGKIIVLVLLILFIQRKPRGLFPQRGRAVEA